MAEQLALWEPAKPVRSTLYLPPTDTPQHRIRDVGPAALSDTEVVALIIGGQAERALETARRLLLERGGVHGLQQASIGELAREHGMGPARAAQVKAALELGRRLLLAAPEERTQIRSPEDIAALLMVEMGHLDQEQLRVLLLDARHQLVRQVLVYCGNVSMSLVRVAEVFKDAIRENCPAIVAVHNHPSSDPSPSPEDVAITREVVEAGRLLDIELVDHLIIGRGRYVSMRERGLGFGA